jgi:hypothetical protein
MMKIVRNNTMLPLLWGWQLTILPVFFLRILIGCLINWSSK